MKMIDNLRNLASVFLCFVMMLPAGSQSSTSISSYRLYQDVLREEYRNTKITARDLLHSEINTSTMRKINKLLAYFVIADGEDSIETGEALIVLWANQPDFVVRWLQENPRAALKISTEIEGLFYYLSSYTLTKKEFENTLKGILLSISEFTATANTAKGSAKLLSLLKEIEKTIRLELES